MGTFSEGGGVKSRHSPFPWSIKSKFLLVRGIFLNARGLFFLMGAFFTMWEAFYSYRGGGGGFFGIAFPYKKFLRAPMLRFTCNSIYSAIMVFVLQPATFHLMHNMHHGSGPGSEISGLLNGRGKRYELSNEKGETAMTPYETFNVQQGKRYR